MKNKEDRAIQKTTSPISMNSFQLLTEDQLNNLLNQKTLLQSQGNYGCDCLLYQGDLIIEGDWLNRESFAAIKAQFPGKDIGTIAIQGNLTIKGDLVITDELLCLFVTGTLTVHYLETLLTEVYVGENLNADTYRDYDGYLQIHGKNNRKS